MSEKLDKLNFLKAHGIGLELTENSPEAQIDALYDAFFRKQYIKESEEIYMKQLEQNSLDLKILNASNYIKQNQSHAKRTVNYDELYK